MHAYALTAKEINKEKRIFHVWKMS